MPRILTYVFPRFSIAGLIAVVAVVALVLAAMLGNPGQRASAAVSATLAALLSATVGACVARDRAVWLGASVFGWGYFVVALGPWTQEDLKPHLVTSGLIADAYDRTYPSSTSFPPIYTPQQAPPRWPDPPKPAGVTFRAPTWWIETPHRFVSVVGIGPAVLGTTSKGDEFATWSEPSYLAFERVGHCGFTRISGGLGALVALWFGRRPRGDSMRPEGDR
ncbi:hypothetical protein [Tautonia plasticadhaerens]|uniref:Uncharacterized protein n=1 Tax=Tautonia plasticadhaerens TaxID=2527974 RepID=A0A518HAY7_9BACT|nr:hypothetical protein [Tautonia plasticadhaerens]QDV38028.1 hypothetical protein ElP_59760 [Tautonia plasticadhaerens]